jgi:hypothetical protein
MEALIERKNEFTSHLIELIKETITKYFIDSYNQLNEKNQGNILSKFQNVLVTIPEWNQLQVENIYNEIKKKTKCKYLEDLIKETIIVYIKIQILSYNINNELRLKRIYPESFIHRVILLSAKEFIKKPYLFYHNVKPIERQYNLNKVEEIVELSIINGIRSFIPIEQIIDVVKNQNIKENNDDEETEEESESEEETEEESESEEETEEESESEEETEEESVYEEETEPEQQLQIQQFEIKETLPEPQPEEQPEEQPEQQPEEQPEPQPEPQPEEQPEPQSEEEQPEPQPELENQSEEILETESIESKDEIIIIQENVATNLEQNSENDKNIKILDTEKIISENTPENVATDRKKILITTTPPIVPRKKITHLNFAKDSFF